MMNQPRSVSPMRILKLTVIFACASVAGSALAGDLKAYHGSFCSAANDGVGWSKGVTGFTARDFMTAQCPIIRDQTDVTLKPRVTVEFFQFSSSDDAVSCSVIWMGEDSTSGDIQGNSETLETNQGGDGQFDFNADVQDPSEPGLTAGGEGSMTLHCRLEANDRVHQYLVEENKY